MIQLRLEYRNLKKEMTQDDYATECIVDVEATPGWHSLGSQINYINYPTLPQKRDAENYPEYSYSKQSTMIDRYRYGVKFTFHVDGRLGKFDYPALVQQILNFYVMLGFIPAVIYACATKIVPGRKHNKERIFEDELLGRTPSQHARFQADQITEDILKMNKELEHMSPIEQIDLEDQFQSSPRKSPYNSPQGKNCAKSTPMSYHEDEVTIVTKKVKQFRYI